MVNWRSPERDPRCDITFSCGIFLFALTGNAPDMLEDADRQMPHQRPTIRERLNALQGVHRERLLGIFDRGFQQEIERRWPSADTLREAIANLIAPGPAAPSEDVMTRLQRVRDRMETTTAQRRTLLGQTLERALQEVHRGHGAVASFLGGHFSQVQSGHSVDLDRLVAANSLGFDSKSLAMKRVMIRCRAEIVGTELIITASHEKAETELWRTNALQPVFGDQFDARVQDYISRAVDDATTPP